MPTLRRLLVLFWAVAAAVGGGWLAGPVGAAGGQTLPEDRRRGLVYEGLRRAPTNSFCAGAFESSIDARMTPWMKQVLCTHGPDPAPEGVDVRTNRDPEPAAAWAVPGATTAAAPAGVPCYGSGSDGFRVQLLYVRSASSADRFPAYEASFNAWAARLDKVVIDSAAETGGTRHIRFVTDSACNLVIQRVTVSSSAMSSFDTMAKELHAAGYSRFDRKYLAWTDSNVYCGISELYIDDRGDPTPGVNYNNGNRWIQGSIARVDNGCWGLSNSVEAHELLHLLGGVQTSAPHATGGFHCNDESDRLCYADGTRNASMRQVCPTAHEVLYDCNHDDYFSTAPAPGSYLSTHWNTANSAFLSGQAPTAPVVTTTTLPPPPPTTTTTLPPTTTISTTTTAPPPITTTSTLATTTSTVAISSTIAATTSTSAPAPATTVTTAPPAVRPPSAPHSLRATQPIFGSGVQLSWSAPASGPVTGYRVYRGTSAGSPTLLTTLPNVLGYNDASAGRSLYYYRVTAFNGVGEGPSSTVVGMIGKAPTAAGTVQESVDRRLLVSNVHSAPVVSRRWP